jgi:hypothetical protein
MTDLIGLAFGPGMENTGSAITHGNSARRPRARRHLSPEVAATLRRSRLGMGWSLRLAAKRTGVSARHLCLLENRHRAPVPSSQV